MGGHFCSGIKVSVTGLPLPPVMLPHVYWGQFAIPVLINQLTDVCACPPYIHTTRMQLKSYSQMKLSEISTLILFYLLIGF